MALLAWHQPAVGDEPIVVAAAGRVLAAAAHAAPSNPQATVPGDFYVEPATLHSLGFEWNIEGDENRNGRVKVEYRRAGAVEWRQALDLLRIYHEQVAATDPSQAYTCGNLYAGSILFLEPATEYDVRLALDDPDGGHAEKLLRVSTKSLPTWPEGGRRLHVYPDGSSGQNGRKESPAFDSFAAAYGESRPGDHVVLHAGEYRGNFELARGGTRTSPIVVRSAGDGPVVITGKGNLFDVTGGHDHWIHGLTFRGGSGGIYNAPGDVGTHGLTVTRCRFEDCYAGVFTRSPACRDLYIADNTFEGTKGSWHRNGEKNPFWKAVWLAGQGVDVCYNRIHNLWDGLSVLHIPPTDDFVRKLSAQDYYNNDVGQIMDDSEADYGQHNVRFFQNRLVDSHCGLSAQPFYGGPCYFVRNLQYNVTRGVVFKLELQPAGVLIYHNTSVSSGTIGDRVVAGLGRDWSNVQVFNNLFLGLNGPTLVACPRDLGISKLDYNGYTFVEPIRFGTADQVKRTETAKNYKSFADLARETGYEQHAVTISFADLVNVKPPQSEAFDTDGATIDARPVKGSAVIDAGLAIPNISDGFTGSAPDLGAFELGVDPPHYGPRAEKPSG